MHILVLLVLSILLACQSKEGHGLSTETALRTFANDWIGTPYDLGGSSKEGIDCSALTQILYKEVFQIELPRRVVQQRLEGLRVARDSLAAGDLVVFRGKLFGRPHIGVYISNNEFLHASSSQGVIISNLEEWYWNRKFSYGRRLIAPNNQTYISLAD